MTFTGGDDRCDLCGIMSGILSQSVMVRSRLVWLRQLTVLAVLTPAAIPGLFIGCLIANMLGGGIMLDVIAGSLTTLVAAYLTWMLRSKSKYLASVPPVVLNALVIPWVLKYGYGEPLPIPFLMGTVGIGEILTASIMGTVLLCVLDRYKNVIFRQGSYTA